MASEVYFVEGYQGIPEKVLEYLNQGYTVYNAPRPLVSGPGDFWQGDFRHGIFYAAVPPPEKDEFGDAPQFHKRNQELDGYVCVIVTRAEVMAYAAKMCQKYSVDIAEFDYEDLVQSYLTNRSNGRL